MLSFDAIRLQLSAHFLPEEIHISRLVIGESEHEILCQRIGSLPVHDSIVRLISLMDVKFIEHHNRPGIRVIKFPLYGLPGGRFPGRQGRIARLGKIHPHALHGNSVKRSMHFQHKYVR